MDQPNVLFPHEAIGLHDSQIATAVRRAAAHLHMREDRIVILPLGEDIYETLRRGMPLSGATLLERDGLLVLDLDGRPVPVDPHLA
jgi:PAS domain-containing protein